MNNSVRKSVLIGLAAAGITLTPGSAATFDDVEFWVGSGTHQAALVLDWNDARTEESLLWGYRWDGIATGMDMFQAVVVADPRLFAHLGLYAWGTATLGIGYDLNANGGFDTSPALPFDGSGLLIDATPSPDDARVATDAADHWVEGWTTGFWGYSAKGSAVDPWTEASTGASDRVLSDGVWDGYSFAPGFASSDPSEPVAATPVPEPSSLSLILLSGLLLPCLRRNRF